MRRIYQFIVLCLLSLLPAAEAFGQSDRPDPFAEAPGDSTILFRFVPGKLMFFSPFRGNDRSILEAARLIERHREEITSGKAWIYIQGFCGSYGSQKENLQAAKNRTNQVKSWFITHHGMKEEYYRTRNSSRSYRGIRDVVALMGIRYAEGYDPLARERALQARRDSLDRLRADSLAALEAARLEQMRLDSLRRAEEELRRRQIEDSLAAARAIPERVYTSTPWYIKSNLVYDALLMPSLEVEYRFSERWSAAVEGNIAWWHNDGKHRYYQLATVIPEVRWWFKPQGDRRGHYLGLFGGGGWYDLENKGTGYRGTGGMAGISYGYMFPVGKYFAFEAGVGVGFMTTRYEEYLPMDGHYVYQQTSRTNYAGPLKLKFAFVWNIGRWTEKGGNR